MTTTLERAARAAEDTFWEPCSENLRWAKIASAVLMAVREQWLEIYHESEGPLPTYEQAEGFPDMIDAILGESE